MKCNRIDGLRFVSNTLKGNRFFFILFFFLFFYISNAQVGTMYGTGMSICNVYNFSVCPTQTITPFNYGNQNYSCNNTPQPDVAFNIMGGGWRVNKFGWFFQANTNGLVRGYNSLGVLQSFTFAATNTITPLSYSGLYVQFAINGIASGTLMSQANFSISLDPVSFAPNSYSYCASGASGIAISPIVPAMGGPWTYTWQPGNINGNPAVVSPTSTTVYTVSAKSSGGCISLTTVSVAVIGSPTVIASNTTICLGDSANISAMGATSYTWNTGSLSNSISVTPTSTASYSVTGAIGNCTNQVVATVSVINSTTLTTYGNFSICAGAATTLSVTGATSYTWSNNATTPSITVNPSSTTSYSVIGSSGTCSSQAVVTVSVIPNTTLSITGNTIICSGQSTTLTASGTSNYIWSSGLTTNTINVSPTTTTLYSVSATGGVCSNTAVATVSVISNPTITVSSNTSICLGATTSATITASGATSYTWANASTLSSSTGSIVNASPNVTTNYSVTGANGSCTNTAVVTVSVNPSPSITSTLVTNTSCGLSNGSATITSTPANNSYTWSSGITSATNIASSLPAGNYTVTAVNGNCQTSSFVSIGSSVPLSILGVTVTPSDCSLNNGSIVVTDSYTNSNYLWSPNVSSTNTATNLTAGNYALTITNGACSASTVFIVSQLNGPTALNVIQSDAICETANGGISILNVVDGTAPYQYDFNNSGYSSVSSYSNLAQGSYTVIVKDANGCFYSQTFLINKSEVILTIDLITSSPSCKDSDGSYVINGFTSGTPPYLTSFNNGPYSSNLMFEQLSAGTYSLNIRDSNMCETPYVLSMKENGEYTLYIPNTFTPNNNTVNDVWFVKGTCLNQFNCIIYNRWGEKIKELNDIKEGWDGTCKGRPVPDGVYVYLIEAETQNGTINKAGHITVFR